MCLYRFFFPVRDRRIYTSISVQSSAFVAPLIVPYQAEIPYSSTGNEPCTTPLYSCATIDSVYSATERLRNGIELYQVRSDDG